MPYLAYAVTVLTAGFQESALRRAPVSYVALAQELGLRNAGTNQDMLSSAQAKELAGKARDLTGEEREQATAYAQAALGAIAGQTASSLLEETSSHELSARTLPSLDFFEEIPKAREITKEDTRNMEQLLDDTINGFNVQAEVRHEYTMIGPSIIRFGILPTGKPVMVDGTTPKRDGTGHIVYASRTKIEQITKREKDLQLALAVKTIRLLPPVPGERYVGVEIPNPYPSQVSLRDILGSREYQVARSRSKLVFALGKDVAGRVQSCDIARAPHLLIAGATGSGKSMLLNTLIASILTQATPEDVRLLMIDPKLVELGLYNGIPHLLRPVVTKVEQAVSLLNNAISEMERRYQLFLQTSVRNLEGYRLARMERRAQGDTTLPNLPAIVIIIDELADLMMMASKEENVEEKICRLAQKARATGIHLVIATQRPSVDVITGLIKANIPTRIALTVAANHDSRTILDRSGAEKLLGRGDMLYLPSDASEPMRIQGAFMTDKDATHLVTYWRVAKSIATGHENWADESEVVSDDDETLEQQLESDEEKREAPDSTTKGIEEDGDGILLSRIITEELPVRTTLSASFVQKQYRIGFQRAARIIERLEQRGFISAPEGGRNERRVLIHSQDSGQEEHAVANKSGV